MGRFGLTRFARPTCRVSASDLGIVPQKLATHLSISPGTQGACKFKGGATERRNRVPGPRLRGPQDEARGLINAPSRCHQMPPSAASEGD